MMKSLRMPKRLTMHANDGKDHMFLVRCGVPGSYYSTIIILVSTSNYYYYIYIYIYFFFWGGG